uniref:Uncharacterized protein n=1 Tax=Tanacetum cinerariifolium TaxID=118510 RepID=A0A6L2P0L0_TANCI|nr:hypothetical protein [Tanacetum cinerariifolium]
MKVGESLNVTFNESLPPPKTSPLEDDDLVEEEAIKISEKKPLGNGVEGEFLENDEIVNIKESKSHPFKNRQANLSRSSIEAENRDVANVVIEIAWLHNLLRELHSPLHRAALVYCDNVAAGNVRVLHVPYHYEFEDIFTKEIPYALFDDFRSSLSFLPSLALSVGVISCIKDQESSYNTLKFIVHYGGHRVMDRAPTLKKAS